MPFLSTPPGFPAVKAQRSAPVSNIQRSLVTPRSVLPNPLPPNIQRRPRPSTEVNALCLAPGACFGPLYTPYLKGGGGGDRKREGGNGRVQTIVTQSSGLQDLEGRVTLAVDP